MKSFKQFLSKIKPILIPVDPVHGAHCTKPAILIPVDPVHGSHSQKINRKKINEGFDALRSASSRDKEWEEHNDNHHLGSHPREIDDKLCKSDKEFSKHPGTEHVKRYSEYSGNINHNLLAGRHAHKKTWRPEPHYTEHDLEWNRAAKKRHKTQVAGIDRALKASKLEHDVHVYHGTYRFNPGELAKKSATGHIKSAAYLSTSIDKSKARSFAGGKYNPEAAHVLHIHMKKGQHGLYLGPRSNFPEEHEMLLPRNTTLKIHPKPTKLPSGVHVWHAHVVDKHD